MPSGAFSIAMPPADETGPGQTILFNNLGPDTVTVTDSTGVLLLSIAAGAQWQIYLVDNTTAAGVWRARRPSRPQAACRLCRQPSSAFRPGRWPR